MDEALQLPSAISPKLGLTDVPISWAEHRQHIVIRHGDQNILIQSRAIDRWYTLKRW